MIIRKTFNNNAVLAEDGGEEFIITGNGIGYNRHIGDEVDEKLIEKKYILAESDKQRYLNIFSGDRSFYDVASRIMDDASRQIGCEFYSEAVIELADHIYFVLERLKKDNMLTFAVNDELMSIYPKEYDAALKSLEVIEEAYDITLPHDEAGFIAFHFVSAEKGSGNHDPLKLMNFVTDVMKIIKHHYPMISREKESLTYSRMLMHLRFLGNRVLRKESLGSTEISMLLDIYNKDRKLRRCVDQIRSFIKEKYDWELSDEEKTYIMIHIQRFHH